MDTFMDLRTRPHCNNTRIFTNWITLLKFPQTDRQIDGQIDRQTEFSAKLSKQKLFRMSTGCQKVSQTDGKIYSAPGRQSDRDRMTV